MVVVEYERRVDFVASTVLDVNDSCLRMVDSEIVVENIPDRRLAFDIEGVVGQNMRLRTDDQLVQNKNLREVNHLFFLNNNSASLTYEFSGA